MTNEEQTISNLRKLKSFHNGSYGADIDRAIKALEQEPTDDATLKDIFCMGCEYKEQEPCEDCISRELVLMELDKYLCGVPFDEKGIDEVIKDLPSVQPKTEQEPKTGRWIKSRDCYGNNHFTCPFCEHDIATKADTLGDNYCSNCGAKLQESEG